MSRCATRSILRRFLSGCPIASTDYTPETFSFSLTFPRLRRGNVFSAGHLLHIAAGYAMQAHRAPASQLAWEYLNCCVFASPLSYLLKESLAIPPYLCYNTNTGIRDGSGLARFRKRPVLRVRSPCRSREERTRPPDPARRRLGREERHISDRRRRFDWKSERVFPG